MVELSAKFKMIDEISDKLERVAAGGESVSAKFEAISETANGALSGVDERFDKIATTADGVATSIDAVGSGTKDATKEFEKLGNEADKTADEMNKAGETGVDAITAISGAIAGAGIAKQFYDMAASAYELVNAMSDAEKIIVNATGASGEVLQGLSDSMVTAFSMGDESLTDAAGAVGEINTRMGLTGDALTDVTDKFLNFSDITGTNVVGSVQNVTKIMNQWDIEANNVESVLDKIAYTAQFSGANVDALSGHLIQGAATFQSVGLTMDNTLRMLGDFELAGINGATAITAMRTAVNKFTTEGLDANEGLKNTITQIAEMEDQTKATALAVEVFGSRAGQQLAQAISMGTISIDTFEASLDEAEGTLRKTAVAGETLSEKWEHAQNAMDAAFSKVVSPMGAVSEKLANIKIGIAEFLNEHPIVTKAIVAIGTGLGVLTGGIVSYTFATNVAIPAVKAFSLTVNAALGPVGWAIAGIGALGVAVATLTSMFEGAKDETADMTALTKEQYFEVQDLTAKYNEASKQYGRSSEEALRLKYQLDDLSRSYEANKQTVEELVVESERLAESVSSASEAFYTNLDGINQAELGTLSLIQKFEDLANQTSLTEKQQKEFEAITKSLAKTYPELGISLDDISTKSDNYAESLKRLAIEKAEQKRFELAEEEYVKKLLERDEITQKLQKTEANLTAELEAHGLTLDKLNNKYAYQGTLSDAAWNDLKAKVEGYQTSIDELTKAQEDNADVIRTIEQNWEDAAEKAKQAADEVLTYSEATSRAFNEVKSEIDALANAYDEVYQAALSSFDGQFELFETATTESEAYMNSTVENAQAALDSQIAYWDSYIANIDVLKNTSGEKLGITQENYETLMAYVQSGSEEAAGLAKSMVDNIASGNEEAVTKLANTIATLEEKEKLASANIAEWQTKFNSSMDDIEKRMKKAIDNMNMDEQAAESAKQTIEGYINTIKASEGDAAAAARQVAESVAAALSNQPISLNLNTRTTTALPAHARGTLRTGGAFIAGEYGPELIARKVEAYANGTTNSKPYYLAGEQGPELIIGEEGSTVFPTSETDKILNAMKQGSQSRSKNETIKRIVIELIGSGKIDATGQSEESILEMLQRQIKPVLINMLRTEVYEEGDFSYDY